MSLRRVASIAVLAVLGLAMWTGSALADARSQDFDTGWKFKLVNATGITDPGNVGASAIDPAFDDSSWDSVTLPHDWSIALDPTPNGGTQSGTGYLQGGLGWYRKSFTLPADDASKEVSVEFDGVYMDSYVYLNGVLIGNHPFGYTHANYDLTNAKAADGTPLLKTGGATNLLAVKVQNQQPSSRWYSGSGIYRNVHLITTDLVHVARYGTFVTTPDLESTYTNGSFANVHVATTLQNQSGASQPVGVLNRVTDADGNVVGTSQSSQTVGVVDNVTDAVDIRLDQPHLWSPDSPYLYTLHTDLMMGGNVIDSTTTRFGVRWFKIDPNQGLTINGKYTKVQGVDLHHDQGALGTAINKDALMRQMKIMRSMGVNAFRTSHNPPSPEMLAGLRRARHRDDGRGVRLLADRQGDVRLRPLLHANSDSDITDMVLAARNDPAVMLWSIGNEIPDSTSTAGHPDGHPARRRHQGGRLHAAGRDRLRQVPQRAERRAPAPTRSSIGSTASASTTTPQPPSTRCTRTYPTKFLFESESSSETSTRGVYQDPDLLNTGENYTPGKRGTSSYDNNLASWTMSGEYGLKKDRDRKYFLGEFLWSGFDYIGEPTPYDVFPVKASFFGAVDTAGFPKDMYWLFRSQWTKDPMVHLLPMNWTDYKPGQNVQVWAYANVDTVELFLNGQSLGVQHFDHKTTTDGRPYLETTGAAVTTRPSPTGACPGSYTSPNGSSGRLHLKWTCRSRPASSSPWRRTTASRWRATRSTRPARRTR